MNKLAKALHAYMKARAEFEGVGYGLTPDFYAVYMAGGIRVFFGVRVDDTGLVEDVQQPAFFEQWKAKPKRKNAMSDLPG